MKLRITVCKISGSGGKGQGWLSAVCSPSVTENDCTLYITKTGAAEYGCPYPSQRPIQQNNPNVFGNTPYAELGDKSQVQYFTKLKPRHAQNIAKQLDMDGVPYSGLSKCYTVTITVRKSDIPRYEAAVAKVKAIYSRDNQQTAPMYDTPQGNMQQNEAAQSIPEKTP